jgi:hypothetical protein
MSVRTMSIGVAGTAGSMMMLSPLISWKCLSTVRRSAPEKSSVIGVPVYFLSVVPESTTEPPGVWGAGAGDVGCCCAADVAARAGAAAGGRVAWAARDCATGGCAVGG